jgi:serine/threonine protein kinase
MIDPTIGFGVRFKCSNSVFPTLFAQMAPEVGTGQPYNEFCDVYSFGVLLWEMMALSKPFGSIDMAGMVRDVWKNCPNAKRPSPSLVDKGKFLEDGGSKSLWQNRTSEGYGMERSGSPTSLQSLVVSCWSYKLDERPTMCAVEKRMWDELVSFCKNHDGVKARHFSVGTTFFSDEDAYQEEESH